MTAVAQPAFPRYAPLGAGEGAPSLRSDRATALIRLAVMAAVMGIYMNSVGIRRSVGPAALVILALAAVYGIGMLLVAASGASYRVRFGSLLVDVLLVTVWIQSTGGPRSEFWTLYLIVVVSAALRFRLLETLGVGVGLTILHVSVMMADGGLPQTQLIYRPSLMIATGFAVGVLAYQRAMHRHERQALEAIAETRTRELGHQRAEVERLREVDLKRSEFVAVAAHEFRTPLAAVIGVLSTLKVHGDVLEDDVRTELIDGAQAQAERLARLVEDLLTVSRLEDGVLRLHPEPVDVRTIVGDAARASGTLGRVHAELARVDPVVCDVDAIVRVLTNLLDNAKKYAPEGSTIVLSASQDAANVRIAVRDSGPGIPPTEREAVFERFRRLDSAGRPGAGLGLYISRGLVEAHGGRMTIGDAPEGGAAFTFTLPRIAAPADVTPVTAPAVVAG